MSSEENRAIARQFIQIWGNADLDIIDKFTDPSFTVYYPIMSKVLHGSKIFKRIMMNFRSAFPDSNLQIEDEIAGDDKVVIKWSFSGTHSGSFMNFPATDKKVTWTGITIYKITDGKIVQERGEEDFLGFLRQIDAIPMG